jgi:hypothetical protein
MLKGQKMSEEQRKKMSKPRTGRIHELLISGSLHRGFKHSEETRKKMSISRRKRPPHSEETKRKISEAVKGEKHPLYGTHPSEETLKKLRESHLGVSLPEEQRKKIGESLKGRPVSIETRKKISEAQSGEKSHNWKGGISFEPYCEKFNDAFKERVRAFFGFQCIECGTPQNGEKLGVHHVQGNKKTCCDNSVPLFVPLCKPCHGKAGHNIPYWEQHFTEIINNYYQGKCYFTQEEMTQVRCS